MGNYLYETFLINYSGSPSVALAEKDSSFHSVMFHPVDNRIVATANAEDGAELWDVREPRKYLVEIKKNYLLKSMLINFDSN